jgi:hypothetical protein
LALKFFAGARAARGLRNQPSTPPADPYDRGRNHAAVLVPPDPLSMSEFNTAVFLALDPRSPLGFLERFGLVLWLGALGRPEGTGFWL